MLTLSIFVKNVGTAYDEQENLPQSNKGGNDVLKESLLTLSPSNSIIHYLIKIHCSCAKTQLKMGIRSLRKNALHSSINILGLAMGIAIVKLIGSYWYVKIQPWLNTRTSLYLPPA